MIYPFLHISVLTHILHSLSKSHLVAPLVVLLGHDEIALDWIPHHDLGNVVLHGCLDPKDAHLGLLTEVEVAIVGQLTLLGTMHVAPDSFDVGTHPI